jgi:hypothetical protein
MYSDISGVDNAWNCVLCWSVTARVRRMNVVSVTFDNIGVYVHKISNEEFYVDDIFVVASPPG